MRHRHPLIAAIYDRMCAAKERAFLSDLRREVVGRARGLTVEIGAGTGLNLSHYQVDDLRHLCLLEPDPHMRERAVRRAKDIGLPVDFSDAAAEDLPFPDCHVDTVVATLVLCSVDDPRRVAAEIRRTLKPEGTLLFIEHVRSNEPWRARLQDLVAPAWRHISGNCHVNRASVKTLREARFAVEEIRRVPRGGPWGNPIVAGVAHPSG